MGQRQFWASFRSIGFFFILTSKLSLRILSFNPNLFILELCISQTPLHITWSLCVFFFYLHQQHLTVSPNNPGIILCHHNMRNGRGSCAWFFFFFMCFATCYQQKQKQRSRECVLSVKIQFHLDFILLKYSSELATFVSVGWWIWYAWANTLVLGSGSSHHWVTWLWRFLCKILWFSALSHSSCISGKTKPKPNKIQISHVRPTTPT